MPRGSNTQTRTFNYITGSSVGPNLLSATNPENGTVTYTYNSDNTLATKKDANGNQFAYSYDSYKRLTKITVGGNTLRTFMYDSNTLDSTYSGSYTSGRLVAVQNTGFTPIGYNGGSTIPQNIQFTEMYAYTKAGLMNGKRLQVNTTFLNQQATARNLDTAYTYDSEAKVTSITYPTTYSYSGSQWTTTAGPTYTYSFDAMDRPTGLKDQNNNTAVSNVSYNAANQYLDLLYFGISEGRTYNSMNQMTNLTVGSGLNITYTFPSSTNNGKISSQTDGINTIR
jgi:YD repeat-containing protein